MQSALNSLLHRMEHILHIKTHALFSLFLASFLPTTQEHVPSVFSVLCLCSLPFSVLLLCSLPSLHQLSLQWHFPSMKLTKSRAELKCWSCGKQYQCFKISTQLSVLGTISDIVTWIDTVYYSASHTEENSVILEKQKVIELQHTLFCQ